MPVATMSGASALGTSAYITDSARLFRVVRPFLYEHPDSALLEDCRTLEVHCYTSDELADMRLRPVENQHTTRPRRP